MKLNSIASIVLYVDDAHASADFYESLGMRPGKREDSRALVYVNWFSIEFVTKSTERSSELRADIASTSPGEGILIGIKVEDIDEFYAAVAAKGYQSEGEPTSVVAGRREFVLHDPSGYRLLFYSK